jgi:protease II
VPGRDRLHRRLDQLLAIGAISVPTPAQGRYFYQRRDGRQNQPVLYLRVGVQGEDRVVIDPNVLDPGGTIALDWYFPSDDGRMLAYGLSENGSEQSVLHLLEVDSGEILPDRIPTPARRIWPGSPTLPVSTTPAIRRRRMCPKARSITTGRSGFTGWARIPPPIGWCFSRRRRSTGPGWESHRMAAGW